jgi:gamma-glutamyltranspeptidase/glutathione hydrolase/leukotriene-C4 hydrolase
MFKNSQDARNGGLSIGVPGELRGLEAAHKRFGVLSWKKLFEPSIELARNGWKVDAVLAKKIESFKKYILKDPVLKSIMVRLVSK